MFKNALDLCKNYLYNIVKEDDVVIDATVGNGNDTLFLKKLVGNGGKVYGFDIQKQSIINTKKLLEENNEESNVELILDSHSELDKYIKENVKAVVFNLGYLPGGDHSIKTMPETTILAVEKSLEILEKDGIICMVIYHGGDSGFYEKDALMEYFKRLNSKEITVITHKFINQINNPPILAIIFKK